VRILIAEDDPDISAALRDLLRTRLPEAEIMVTVNGEMALWATENAILTGKTFDLIISDWAMPKLTGIDLLRKVRANPMLTRVPFILLTAINNKTQIVEAARAGVSAYVTKPLVGDTLMSKVKTVLETPAA
jgi:two-component system chemotaxis response regulator CheY